MFAKSFNVVFTIRGVGCRLIIFNFQFSSLYDNDGLTTFAKSLNVVFTIMFAKNLNIVFRFFETMGGWM